MALGSPVRSAFSYSPRVGAARSTSRLGFTRSRPYLSSTSRMTFSARCLLSHSLTTCPSKSTREAIMWMWSFFDHLCWTTRCGEFPNPIFST